MSLTLTNPEFIDAIQIIAIVGFIFLALFTLRSYFKIKERLILFISLAFLVLALSIIFKMTIVPEAGILGIEEEYLEALTEGIQFLAAFLFFYGLKMIKSKDQED